MRIFFFSSSKNKKKSTSCNWDSSRTARYQIQFLRVLSDTWNFAAKLSIVSYVFMKQRSQKMWTGLNPKSGSPSAIWKRMQQTRGVVPKLAAKPLEVYWIWKRSWKRRHHESGWFKKFAIFFFFFLFLFSFTFSLSSFFLYCFGFRSFSQTSLQNFFRMYLPQKTHFFSGISKYVAAFCSDWSDS